MYCERFAGLPSSVSTAATGALEPTGMPRVWAAARVEVATASVAAATRASSVFTGSPCGLRVACSVSSGACASRLDLGTAAT
jgi:hypothetical protein